MHPHLMGQMLLSRTSRQKSLSALVSGDIKALPRCPPRTYYSYDAGGGDRNSSDDFAIPSKLNQIKRWAGRDVDGVRSEGPDDKRPAPDMPVCPYLANDKEAAVTAAIWAANKSSTIPSGGKDPWGNYHLTPARV